jgi:UDP-N-acetylmuramoylalanine--D-glutamate ligase
MMTAIHQPGDLNGVKVLLLGLGVNQGGLGVARFLATYGAEVRVTDLQTAEQLAGPLAELGDLDISYTLGRHDEADFEWADLVVRNPAVPRESSWLELARNRGISVEMEMTLFFRFCRAPIIGVTGTKGKTTTTSILGNILHQRWPAAVIAGNMGRTALGQLSGVEVDVPVALELSSFQIEALDEQGLSPHIAVLTNISEDHLDRYRSLEEYAGVKASITRHQRPEDWLIVPAGDDPANRLTADSVARRVLVGSSMVEGDFALWVDGDRFAGRWDGEPVDLGAVEQLRIPGTHNLVNALAASAAALAAGVDPAEIRAGLSVSTPVANRLETVAVIDGVTWINDTTATTPIAGIAALEAFAGRQIILIAGGSSKNANLEPFADAIRQHADQVILLDGTATPGLQMLLKLHKFAGLHGPYDAMTPAVQHAADLAEAGAVVLLSPGCASFGMFRNEFHRGDEFRRSVHLLIGDEQ